jgi:hypothetical protein
VTPLEFTVDWRQVPITLGPDGLYHGSSPSDTSPTASSTAGTGPAHRRQRGPGQAPRARQGDRGRPQAAPGRTPTVEEWFSTWLTDIAPYGRRALRPRTLADYWSKCRNWIFPNLGGRQLDDLEPEDLDRLYAKMRRARRPRATVLKVHAILRRGLGVAHARGKVTRNVAAMVDPPGGGTPKRTPLPRRRRPPHRRGGRRPAQRHPLDGRPRDRFPAGRGARAVLAGG